MNVMTCQPVIMPFVSKLQTANLVATARVMTTHYHVRSFAFCDDPLNIAFRFRFAGGQRGHLWNDRSAVSGTLHRTCRCRGNLSITLRAGPQMDLIEVLGESSF